MTMTPAEWHDAFLLEASKESLLVYSDWLEEQGQPEWARCVRCVPTLWAEIRMLRSAPQQPSNVIFLSVVNGNGQVQLARRTAPEERTVPGLFSRHAKDGAKAVLSDADALAPLDTWWLIHTGCKLRSKRPLANGEWESCYTLPPAQPVTAEFIDSMIRQK